MNKKIKLLVAAVLILITSCEKEKLDYEIFGTWRWEKSEHLSFNPPNSSILDVFAPDENYLVKLILTKNRIKWNVNGNLTYSKTISSISYELSNNIKIYRINIFDKSQNKTEHLYVRVESQNTISLSGGPFYGGSQIYGWVSWRSYYQRIK